MKIKGDISGLDELEERISDTFFSKLIEIGRDAVRFAQHNGEYKNHTFNLRNAPGFCVVKDGKIIHLEIGDDGGHPEALKNTENILIYSEKPQDGLYLADGMPYASFVETEKRNGGFQLPQSFSEALQLAADQAKRIEEQQKQIERKDKAITKLQPKADFADAAFKAEEQARWI